jgi:magnesium chelatase subunit H
VLPLKLMNNTRKLVRRYPEPVAVTLWGLDAIKTRGESVAIALVGQGRSKRARDGWCDLISCENGAPTVSTFSPRLSGIFRDSFANVVNLLDDMFERAAQADRPAGMNFHQETLKNFWQAVLKACSSQVVQQPPGITVAW